MGKKEMEPNIDSVTLKTSKKKKKNKRVGVILITILGIGVLIFLNKDSLYRQVAKFSSNIPGFNKVFKLEEDSYMNLSKEALNEEVQSLKGQIKSLEEKLNKSLEENTLLEQKIASLEVYETRYEEFMLQKNKWDKEIAKSNPNMFIEQFEKIYPEEASQIYKELKQKAILTKEQKEYAKIVAEMDEEQAAKVLETIVSTDPELIKLIFNGMQLERRSLILSAMDASIAAQTIKILSPDIESIIP